MTPREIEMAASASARPTTRRTPETHRVSPHRLRAGHPRTHWFCGRRFCVSYLQHDQLESLLPRDSPINLDALYPQWDEEAERDPPWNLLPWLRSRVQRAHEAAIRRASGPPAWLERIREETR